MSDVHFLLGGDHDLRYGGRFFLFPFFFFASRFKSSSAKLYCEFS